MSDLVERLRKASTYALMSAARETVVEAAAEIEAMSKAISRQSNALGLAMKEISDFSFRSGYYEGALLVITTIAPSEAAGVARRALARFDEPSGTTQEPCAKPRKTSKPKLSKSDKPSNFD